MNDQLFDLAYGKYLDDVARGARNEAHQPRTTHHDGPRTRLALTLAVAAQRLQPSLSWSIRSDLPSTANA